MLSQYFNSKLKISITLGVGIVSSIFGLSYLIKIIRQKYKSQNKNKFENQNANKLEIKPPRLNEKQVEKVISKIYENQIQYLILAYDSIRRETEDDFGKTKNSDAITIKSIMSIKKSCND